jgi:hypothetical protein
MRGSVTVIVVNWKRPELVGRALACRIALIERNRVLLAARHFPFSLLWRNGYYYALRIAGGIRAAARNEGESALHRGMGGKARLVWGLFAGDLSALWNLPGTFYKRTCRTSQGIRKLKPREIHNLIVKNGISTHEISTMGGGSLTSS